jgi:predicted RNase H-like HicB family nuclease
MSRFTVYAKWDSEAGVWTAYSDDIPGLVTEASSWDELKDRLRTAAAELILLNNVKVDSEGGELQIVTDERVSVLAA